jgi:S-adenosylmethionine hydrolase
MPSTIALITDFGLQDTYVAAMKSVIYSILGPQSILDLTHQITPGDIQQAAFEIWRIHAYLPTDSVIIAVVDPGVGTSRKAIALQFPGLACVGPDNGIFSYLLEMMEPDIAVTLTNQTYWRANQSRTFHGRDIFAPVGAHIAEGISFGNLGENLAEFVQLPSPHLLATPGVSIEGEVIHIDQFGNLITSIGILVPVGDHIRFEPWLAKNQTFEFSPEGVRIQFENHDPIQLFESFGSVPLNSRLAYIGSSGLLEVGVNQGDARTDLGLDRGSRVRLTF